MSARSLPSAAYSVSASNPAELYTYKERDLEVFQATLRSLIEVPEKAYVMLFVFRLCHHDEERAQSGQHAELRDRFRVEQIWDPQRK